jgi:hypothetical protein
MDSISIFEEPLEISLSTSPSSSSSRYFSFIALSMRLPSILKSMELHNLSFVSLSGSITWILPFLMELTKNESFFKMGSGATSLLIF